MIDLPKPISDFVAANARLDTEGMLTPFTKDAVVMDNGRRFEGQAEIRHLFEKEVVPVRAIFTPDVVREEDDRIVVEGLANGAFPGSPLRFIYRFTLSCDAIQSLEITL